MTFPCELDIKVFTKAETNLEESIHSMLQVHLQDSQILSIKSKDSSKGKYRSLSCRVVAESRVQIDKVYADLGDRPEIIMLL